MCLVHLQEKVMTFSTMLAGKVKNASDLHYPLLASPKLDGVRCHIIDGTAISRNLLKFRNPGVQKKFGKVKLNGLDGELMVGDPTHPEAFRQTGLLNSLGGDCSKVKLFVFDDFSQPNASFIARLERAHRRIESYKLDFAPVEHRMLNDGDQLLEYEADCLSRGYEGVMVRSLEGRYKYGRSTTREGWLLKLKRFEDSEAVIDDAEELMHNANEKTLMRKGKLVRNSKKEGKIGMDTLGAVNCRDIHDGRPVDVGSGFTAAERAALWRLHKEGKLIGKVIKYKHFPSGGKDKPRFPIFLGFRDEIDL